MFSRFCFFLCFLLCLSLDVSAKVRILTFHFNKPDFIELQYKSFKKFLTSDFELIVFNDAALPTKEREIQEMCDKYSIQCVRFQPEWHLSDPLNHYLKSRLDNPSIYSHVGGLNSLADIAKQPSVRHCHAIQYALDHYGYNHDDLVIIIDGDAFPMRPLNLKKMLHKHDIAGIQKLISYENVDYLWVVFVAFDPRKIPNPTSLKFHMDVIGDKMYDTGAHSYHYLANNPTVRVNKVLGEASSGFYHWTTEELVANRFKRSEVELIQSLPRAECVEFHMDRRILHFGASSFGLEGHDQKSHCVTEFINKITSSQSSTN